MHLLQLLVRSQTGLHKGPKICINYDIKSKENCFLPSNIAAIRSSKQVLGELGLGYENIWLGKGTQ